jgi:hypothetical protein
MHKSNRLPESPGCWLADVCAWKKAEEMGKFSEFPSEYEAQKCGKFSHHPLDGRRGQTAGNGREV